MLCFVCVAGSGFALSPLGAVTGAERGQLWLERRRRRCAVVVTAQGYRAESKHPFNGAWTRSWHDRVVEGCLCSSRARQGCDVGWSARAPSPLGASEARFCAQHRFWGPPSPCCALGGERSPPVQARCLGLALQLCCGWWPFGQPGSLACLRPRSVDMQQRGPRTSGQTNLCNTKHDDYCGWHVA